MNLADDETNDRWSRELDDGMTETYVGMTTQVDTHAAVAESVVVWIVTGEACCTQRLNHRHTVLHGEAELVW